jgi:hypothetical protein
MGSSSFTVVQQTCRVCARARRRSEQLLSIQYSKYVYSIALAFRSQSIIIHHVVKQQTIITTYFIISSNYNPCLYCFTSTNIHTYIPSYIYIEIMTSYEMPETDWLEVQALPGNNVCVDCGVDSPDWASVTHGILLCLQCSGPHRYVAYVERVERSCIGMMKRYGGGRVLQSSTILCANLFRTSLLAMMLHV